MLQGVERLWSIIPAPSVMGIDEILNDILKNNFSGTDPQVCVAGHAERSELIGFRVIFYPNKLGIV